MTGIAANHGRKLAAILSEFAATIPPISPASVQSISIFPEAVRGQLRCIPLRKEWLRLSSDAVSASQSQRNRLDSPSPMRRANQPACWPSLSQRYNTLDFLRKSVCHETSGFFGFFPPRGRCPLWIPPPTGMLRTPYWMTLRQRKADALLWNPATDTANDFASVSALPALVSRLNEKDFLNHL